MSDDPTEGLIDGLVALGWDAWTQRIWTALDRPVPVGRVARLDRGWSTVWTATAAGATSMRVKNIGAAVTVGDWVVVSPDGERVLQVLDRFSAFVRRSSFEGDRAQAHVLAANVDTVFLVHSLTSPPNQRRVERELVLAFDSGAEPVMVLAKSDIADDVDAAVQSVADVALGVPVHAVSARTGFGVNALRRYTADHRTVALLGASGAGKSTLVNALVGHDAQRTGEVRTGDQRGRHTTVASELVRLPDGGLLLDTPGLRAVSLWTDGDGFHRAFSDVTALAHQCRFRDCHHESEPGCAVRQAVADGGLTEMRFTSWKRLNSELETLEIERDEADRQAGRGRRPPRRSGR